MNLFLTAAYLAFATFAQAASDTDVSLIKAEKVIIEENSVTIVGAATTSVITLSGDHQPDYKGVTFMGRPSNRTTIKSDKATFVIRRPPEARVGQILEKNWDETLQSARNLQAGQDVGRIGYYRPEVVIRENLITSIDGPGFLYAKGR